MGIDSVYKTGTPESRAERKATRQEPHQRDSTWWATIREETALKLFHSAAERVPAYADFLKKHSINPISIRAFSDLRHVPPTDKTHYLRQYPLPMLCWEGTLANPLTFTSTSGSSGQPFYFPRSERLEWQSSIAHEQFLMRSSFGADSPTLVIVCFAMGAWIGGLITYKAVEMASRRNSLPVSVITPGINKHEIFEALRCLAPHYEQIVLTGYPPFIKDVIDEAPAQGISLAEMNLRIIFAAEPFTETFRDYVGQKAGIKNLCLDTMNVYGSADLGTMAWETPLTVHSRRRGRCEPRWLNQFLPVRGRTPTLAQYHPSFICFEQQEDQLLLTGDSAIPLIRYAIGDRGGVIGFDEFVGVQRDNGIDVLREIADQGLSAVSAMPLVYVYERADFATKLYGAIIFPEPFREALHHESVATAVTGKFTIVTQVDSKLNQFLEVNVELRSCVGEEIGLPVELLRETLRHLIVEKLLEHNSEFKIVYAQMQERVLPRLVFWPYEHPEHFKLGGKQKWVKETNGNGTT